MRARRLVYPLLIALLLLVVSGASASAATSFDPGDPGDQATNEPVPVIILADDPAAVIKALPATAGAELLPLIGGISATLTPDQIQAAAELPGVRDIQADDDVVGVGWSEYLSFTNSAVGLGAVIPPYQGGPAGKGVTVAILDSGIDDNVDLLDSSGRPRLLELLGLSGRSRLLAFKDFTTKIARKAYDDAGHGTFVAGLIAGNGASSLTPDQGGKALRQYRGVAPQANIVSLKVLDRFGEGRKSNVIRAIDWAITNKSRYNIRVMNISLGGDVAAPVALDPLALAVEAAWKSGIVVVTAAGNEGEFGMGGILSPGNDPYVITVGASNTQQTADTADDRVCGYSSIGPTMYDEIVKPDVVAPGNRNISLRVPWSFVDWTWPENRVPVNSYLPSASRWALPHYFTLSGTSTAAPVVSGVVALLLSADPSLTPDDIKLRLMETADPLPEAQPLQGGAGAVDVPGALASSTLATGYALSPKAGSGTAVLPADTYDRWNEYKWTKYRWTKYRWAKYRWTKYRWTKYRWTKYRWTALVEGE